MPGWAMLDQIIHDFWPNRSWLLLGFGITILALQAWIIWEAVQMWPRAQGVLEETLPPLEPNSSQQLSGGRSC